MTQAREADRDLTSELLRTLAEHEKPSPEYRRARDELVQLHQTLVRYVARRYLDRGESLDDLVQIGTIGLINAIDRFDLERAVEFSTFAIPNIAGEIKRHFRDRGWMLSVPRRLKDLQPELARAMTDLTELLGRSPTVSELAARMNLTPDDVIAAIESSLAYSALPLDAPAGANGRTIADSLADPSTALAHVELRHALAPALAELPERERTALSMRFMENRTQSEIAQALGLSQVHVSRMLTKALATLRRRLPDIDLD
jgi:RNA polymerase sigma-B factor